MQQNLMLLNDLGNHPMAHNHFFITPTELLLRQQQSLLLPKLPHRKTNEHFSVKYLQGKSFAQSF